MRLAHQEIVGIGGIVGGAARIAQCQVNTLIGRPVGFGASNWRPSITGLNEPDKNQHCHDERDDHRLRRAAIHDAVP